MPTTIYQRNNAKGWALMLAYWAIGLSVGIYCGYLQKMVHAIPQFPKQTFTWDHLLALVATIAVQPRLLSRFDPFGRPTSNTSLGISIIFAAMNGAMGGETFLFLASYDLGYKYTGNSHIGGFSSFSLYSALIHAKFWLPHGFPQHLPPTAPPFYKHGLPALILMSATWMKLYASTGDVFFVCLCHGLTDFFAARKIALQSPFSSTRKSTNGGGGGGGGERPEKTI
jgi:hypothetical protein